MGVCVYGKDSKSRVIKAGKAKKYIHIYNIIGIR